MLSLASRVRVWVASEPVDFRKAFDGLCGVIHSHLSGDPYSGDVYVFFNRRRNRVKLLVWDANGFWLFYKRLERGTFEDLRTSPDNDGVVRVDRATMAMLLEGIDTKKSKFRHHFARAIRIESGDGRKPRDSSV